MKRRVLLALLTVLLLPGLPGAALTSGLASAAVGEVRWCRVPIPTEGETGGWVLASGADVSHLTSAADGTLYCYATPTGTNRRLFKSTDGGNRWLQTGGVQDAIVDIVSAPDDASTIYYASSSAVYRSTDAGSSFTPLPANPGGSGSNNVEITSIDITRHGAGNLVAVGTRDADGSEYGGVFILDENDVPAGWVDTNAGNCDVCCVGFSPRFSDDGQLIAVATDETDAFVLARIGDENWGATIAGATIPAIVPESAAIGFPDDYHALTEGSSLFIGVDAGNGDGDVYRVTLAANALTSTDLDTGMASGLASVDVASLAVAGNTASASLLAGAASSAEVYVSGDGGLNWAASAKAPTGQSSTHVLMSPGFDSGAEAFAVTSGLDSAFSRTTDGGATWDQVSLIDTVMSGIVDVAVSPNHRFDNTLFMLTHDAQHVVQSLWRSVSDGASWERLLSTSAAQVDGLQKVLVSDGYASNKREVFLAGTGNGGPAIWTSEDGGQTFVLHAAPLAVAAWCSRGNALFVAGYDGSEGLVYRFDTAGFSPPTGATVGSQPLTSLAASPRYDLDQTILAGNDTGQVYWSRDGGANFCLLGQQLPVVNGTGEVSAAFDPTFSNNGAVYAVSSAAVGAGDDERIFRLVVGRDDAWQSMGGALPTGAEIKQVAIAAAGPLYAIDSQAVDVTAEKGGMVRSLNPAFSLSPTFETVTRGLEDGATMVGLWASGGRLWSVDAQAVRLMTYLDTMCTPVVLASPANQAPGMDTANASLSWAGPLGSTQYEWQVDYDGNFASVPEGFEGKTSVTSVRLPTLQPGTTYYWRVRAAGPVLSPWSARRSFTTVLGLSVTALELLSPTAGAADVPRKPVFQWDAVAGADGYELLVSTDVLFTDTVIEKEGRYALPATAWKSDILLDYDTTYYWKVRGCSEDSLSAWSAVSAFTIEAAPPPAEPEQAHSDPAPPESEQTHADLASSDSAQAHTNSTPPDSSPTAGSEQLDSSPTQDPGLAPAEMPARDVLAPQMSPPAQTTVQVLIPDWVSYAVVALLSMMVLLLVIILVLVATSRRA